MAHLFVWAGMTAAAGLLVALVATIIRRDLHLWPTPGPGTWQSYVFWPLFRGLNVLCFLTAATNRDAYFGLPPALRVIAAAGLVASIGLFVYAFRVLGRDNSYGAQDGLVTGGIYRFSRNPQNAMLMVVYACLAVAADNGPTYLLCSAMIAAYALMVLAEEPWLRSTYGEAYSAYCARVPRFFGWRAAARALLGGADAAHRS